MALSFPAAKAKKLPQSVLQFILPLSLKLSYLLKRNKVLVEIKLIR